MRWFSPLVRYAGIVLWVSLMQRSATGEAVVSQEHGAWRLSADADGTVQLATVSTPGTTLKVRTVGVWRGADALDGAVRVSGEGGGLAIARERFVERFMPVANGIEQTWLFAEPVPGTGDLMVRVEMPNARPRVRADGSVAVVAGEGVLRYGQALWVDASNTRTPVAVEVQQDMLLLRVPASVLERSRFPALLDPVISTDLEVDPAVFTAAVARSQRVPQVAFDGTQTLVVWEDHRDPAGIAVYGARVAADGTVLDPGGFAISTGADHFEPVVAFDGTNFVVAWTDMRSGSSTIYGARVTPSGGVLDPAGILISDAGVDHRGVSLAADGNQVLVVWSSAHAGSRGIWGKRFARGASVSLDTMAQLIADPPANQELPQVVAGGGQFMVVFRDARNDVGDIYGIRVRPNGTPIEAAAFPVAVATQLQDRPQIAVGIDTYVVVWQDERNPWPAYSDVYGARISFAGAVLDPNGRPLFEAFNQDNSPTVAFDGTNVIVAWFRARDPMPNGYTLVAARFAADFTPIGAGSFDVSVDHFSHFSPALAFTGAGYLAVYETEEMQTGDIDLRFSTLGLDGLPRLPSDVNLTARANDQQQPGVGFNGTRYLVAWNDTRGGDAGIYGSVVQPDGGVESPSGFPISLKPNRSWSFPEGSPDVASDGTDYLVVWGDAVSGNGELRAARVRADGTVIDSQGLLIASGPGRRYWPRAVFDGVNYFVVWADTRNGRADIFGARVGRDGTVRDLNGFAIHVSAFNKDRPGVAFDGTRFLVVWSEGVPDDNSDDVFAHRVSLSGTVLEASPIAVSAANSRQFWANVAYQNGLFWVVWHDHRDGQDANALARVAPDGTVLDTNGRVFTGAGAQLDVPEVVNEGQHLLVVWPQKSAGADDLWGLQVEVDGGFNVDGGPPQPFLVSGQPANERYPKLASNQQGQVLVAYQRFRSELGADRVSVRAVNRDALVQEPQCQGDASCASGPCDGGACVELTARRYTVGCDCHSATGGWQIFALLAALTWVGRRSTRQP